MEDNTTTTTTTKRRGGGSGGSGGGANSSEPASTDPHSGRKRGGALKRKANNSSSSLNDLSSAMLNSNSSKRFMREKAAIALMQAIYNGPCTRAAAASASSAVSSVLIEPVAMSVKVEDGSSVSEEWKALENAIEAEYEVVRSREAVVHVVPNHCGWFSWIKHHLLEEKALPSFFDGKLENRTPETYMEIRNWIVKKFHANPNKQIEIKELEDLNVGDLDARQEVMEFLDYWGLINFHPFTQTETVSSDVKTEEKESDGSNDLAEKLFKFETMQWCPPVVQKSATPKPLTPKLLAEPTIPDDSVKPEGPSVEYHCNSCSTDCSRKRYHCQKQADFDLCTECFNNGKLGSDMSLSDFILMEPAEAPGLSSATWTDQETLLLLEALELYKENWNEIAEHVATKTKDQCILHFVQMPIEDSFLDSDVDNKEACRDGEDMGLVAPSNDPETTDGMDCANNEAQSCIEKSKQENASEVNGCQENDENIALKALKEAFEAVGSLPEPGFEPTFADAGNPVMAMAIFLARFVGSDAATASSRSSLKALSSTSPGIELATRHCFILEDPPSDTRDSVGSESTAFDLGDRSVQKDGKLENLSIHKEAEDLPGDLRNCDSKKNESVKDDSIPMTKTKGIDEDKPNATKKTGTKKIGRAAKKSQRKNSLNGKPRENDTDSALKPSQEAQKDLNLAGPSKENSGLTTMAENLVKNNTKPDDPVKKTVMEDHVEETAEKEDTAETDHVMKDPVEKNDKLSPVPSSLNGPKDEAGNQLEPSNAVDESETDLTPKSPEVSGSHEGDAIKIEAQNSGESKDIFSIDKVKRAAITTLAAAAVKAQLLADHEEDEIKKLAVFLIDKELRKLELKMALFEDLGNVTTRVKEQLERTRQKLYQERAQIIAARLGALSSSHPRPMSSAMPQNRNAINFANSSLRPPIGMNSLRPPIGSRPTMPFPQASTNQFPPSALGRSGLRPQSQQSKDNISSARMN